MKTPKVALQELMDSAAHTVLGSHYQTLESIRPCADVRHGDFQSNVALIYGKSLQRSPRELAEALVAAFPANSLVAPLEIAGPGFINFRLLPEYCSTAVTEASRCPRLGVALTSQPRRVVLDYSGPNIAKEMHVGHIRSTILGESLARVWRFLGHQVITDNHLGDWGTQFGKILVGFKKSGQRHRLETEPVAYLESLYQEINLASKEDPTIQEQARAELVKLQQGDQENLSLWKEFITYTQKELDKIYQRLGVKFDYTLGESYFHDRLDGVVTELVKLGIAKESEGAICVFFPENSALADKPFLIQKSDEGFLYATTDLAALDFRIKEWQADHLIYVTDGRQQLHFQQLFATATLWGKTIPLEHVWFGAILGEDKKPIKTREGEPIKLRRLLDEAEERALKIIEDKRPELPLTQKQKLPG